MIGVIRFAGTPDIKRGVVYQPRPDAQARPGLIEKRDETTETFILGIGDTINGTRGDVCPRRLRIA